MKHFFVLAVLFSVLLLFSACGGTEGTSDSGGISGYVTEVATGEPIANSKVVLDGYFENQAALGDYFDHEDSSKYILIGETTLTGSDGMFEFIDLNSGIYVITVSKDGYEDEDKDIDYFMVTVKDKMVRYNISLRKKNSNGW